MKNIFIINGMGGSGKNTFVDCINEVVPTLHISIVDPVKEIASTLGWTGNKSDADRKFLYELKQALDNYKDSNYGWIREQVELFDKGKLAPYKVLCIDMREEHQVERARKDFGAKIVLVKRSGVKDITTNPADANVYKINYDITVDNSGSLDELKEEAKKFVKKYIEK